MGVMPAINHEEINYFIIIYIILLCYFSSSKGGDVTFGVIIICLLRNTYLILNRLIEMLIINLTKYLSDNIIQITPIQRSNNNTQNIFHADNNVI